MKKAVILFNLGGPDSLDAVGPFLFNLFYDVNIIRLVRPIRFILAKIISSKRAPIAKEIYKKIGNKSPILEETKQQAQALQDALNKHKTGKKAVEYKVFVSMRYWHPFSYEVVDNVKEYSPDEIILLPLYPQFSTTTSKSSVEDWLAVANRYKLEIPTKSICNFHLDKDFITAHTENLSLCYESAVKSGKVRVLFSAHGLPEKVILNGDPYQKQVEETVSAVVKQMDIQELDFVICYQSRVGRLKWIGPSTDSEIERAAKDEVGVVVVPIAFVSEHSETLVELDIEYKHLALSAGIKNYFRVPTLRCHEKFITALVNVIEKPESYQCNCYTN